MKQLDPVHHSAMALTARKAIKITSALKIAAVKIHDCLAGSVCPVSASNGLRHAALL